MKTHDLPVVFALSIHVLTWLGAVAQDVSVTMMPLRYCSDKRWWGCNRRSYPYGNYWDAAGMSGDNQDKAFMAIMGNAPSASSIKYIAIFSSGQQGSSGSLSEDYANVVSGAHNDWKWNTNENGSEPRTVQSESVAGSFYNDQTRFLSHSDTLYLSIWDPQFNHMASSTEKEQTLEGYATYLNSKVNGNWANVEGVVVAGASRGGCLAMRLAQDLRSRYSLTQVKFAIGSIDGVCKYTQDEFGVTSDTIDNPVSTAPSSYKSYKTDISQQFAGPKENYCIWHLALGDEVTGLGLGVRGFTHETCTAVSCQLVDSSNQPYYTQKWDDMCHICAGRNYDAASLAKTVEPLLDHFEGCMARFGW